MRVTAARWIELDGAANVRDLGGLPTVDGREVRPGRLIRSDNLQGLSERDVHLLVDELGVRTVADLRTSVEVSAEGPGPLAARDDVAVENLSLFPEAGESTDAGALADGDDDAPIVLPWQTRERSEDGKRRGAAGVYLSYLGDRSDSVLATLRLIAHTPGATIVHCAAGKDRTGVVVAIALAEVGVERTAIVEDYALSADRIEAIFARLRASRTYADDLANEPVDKHRPKALTMQHLLEEIDDRYGGVGPWLRGHGWTAEDAAALRRALLD